MAEEKGWPTEQVSGTEKIKPCHESPQLPHALDSSGPRFAAVTSGWPNTQVDFPTDEATLLTADFVPASFLQKRGQFSTTYEAVPGGVRFVRGLKDRWRKRA